MQSEYAVIGGGVVGLSVALGLTDLDRKVVVFDEGDFAHRASRGNFGLVWVQGKGASNPAYARWTRTSALAWQQFADRLQDATGVDLSLRQNGGFNYQLSESGLEAKANQYARLRDQLEGDYPFEVLRGAALRAEEPNVGTDVVGAILHQHDGHVNPLRLLRALATQTRQRGVTVENESRVGQVNQINDGFEVRTEKGKVVTAQKIVICAGLGAAKIGPTLGFKAQVRPQRGQILVTEKLPKVMHRPSATIRQVDEGSVQIGATADEAGMDDQETIMATAGLAREAAQVFPLLGNANIVRSWAALRIMSPDGLPIYQQSDTHPGAFLVTCHSGITLAAAHATQLPRWIDGRDDAPELSAFGEGRFDV